MIRDNQLYICEDCWQSFVTKFTQYFYRKRAWMQLRAPNLFKFENTGFE